MCKHAKLAYIFTLKDDQLLFIFEWQDSTLHQKFSYFLKYHDFQEILSTLQGTCQTELSLNN